MKKLIYSLAVLLSMSFSAQSQISDFTFTDTDDNMHTLYTWLSAGKAVVLEPIIISAVQSRNFNSIMNDFYVEYGFNSGRH